MVDMVCTHVRFRLVVPLEHGALHFAQGAASLAVGVQEVMS